MRDKLIAGAIRGAFADVLARDRHAVTVLFLTLDPADVDVNVHPAKADVRFRDPGLVRGLIVGAIREALAGAGIRAATTGAAAMMDAFRAGPTAYAHPGPANGHRAFNPAFRAGIGGRLRFRALAGAAARSKASARRRRPNSTPGRSTAAMRAPARCAVDETVLEAGLGAARAQIHENYIVAQTARFAGHRRPACRA